VAEAHCFVPGLHATHPPFRHTGVPPLHAWPHVPQLLTSVIVLRHALEQLVRPVLQLIPQLDPLQMALPTELPLVGGEQAVVHDVPQLLPVDGLWHTPLQLSVPFGHWHAPPVQTWPPAHVWPHDPQLPVSLISLTHALEQGEKPLLQLIPQVDPLQVAVPVEPPVLGPEQPVVHDVPQLLAVVELSQVPLQLSVPFGHTHEPPVHSWPLPHVLPHVPQLAVSVIVLVHVEPHRFGFAEFGHTHVPLWQLWTDGHAWAHDPQFWLSVLVFVHTLPQKLGFAVVGHAHVPDWHVSAAGHALPQAPQLLPSLCRVEQVPLQLLCPAAHPLVHANVAPDALQTDVAPEQPAPQLAQFVVVPRAAAQPVPVLPQSAYPVAQA
jgi:hypothetical protein